MLNRIWSRRHRTGGPGARGASATVRSHVARLLLIHADRIGRPIPPRPCRRVGPRDRTNGGSAVSRRVGVLSRVIRALLFIVGVVLVPPLVVVLLVLFGPTLVLLPVVVLIIITIALVLDLCLLVFAGLPRTFRFDLALLIPPLVALCLRMHLTACPGLILALLINLAIPTRARAARGRSLPRGRIGSVCIAGSVRVASRVAAHRA